MIIDVHGHLVPPELLAAIRKESGCFRSLRLIEDGASLAIAFAGGGAAALPQREVAKMALHQRRRNVCGGVNLSICWRMHLRPLAWGHHRLEFSPGFRNGGTVR
jgi:hypothetical protein